MHPRSVHITTMRRGLDNIYLNLDTGIPGALLRIALGTCLVMVTDAVDPGADPWALSAYLLVMLLAVKVFAGVARRVVAASSLVHSHWEWRRNLARYYDSYQWRKLLWFGAGILTGDVLRSPSAMSLWIVGLTCLAVGGCAEVLWRRHNLGIIPPAS